MSVVQNMRVRSTTDRGLETGWRTRSREDQAPKAGVVSWRTRLSVLPRGARVVLLALLACAAAPGAASLYAALWGTRLAAVLREHRSAVLFAALLAAGAVVVVFELPRAASPGAYARQLRDRVLHVQSSFDGALRRRARERKERNHAEPHSLDPNR